jgi:hypothetical protein
MSFEHIVVKTVSPIRENAINCRGGFNPRSYSGAGRPHADHCWRRRAASQGAHTRHEWQQKTSNQ